MTRDHATAAHEAAHVVVGVALGLRLRLATVGHSTHARGPQLAGYADFYEKRGDGIAQAIMLAAGIAWDRGLRYDPWYTSIDREECFKIVRGRQSVEACVAAAAAMLAARKRVHARVTAALLERDLTHDDVVAMAAPKRRARGTPRTGGRRVARP